jgi:enoyl-CoA hydratase/carnithine racemase
MEELSLMGSYDDLVYEKQDGVVKITLNRPERLNAMTKSMYVELREALLESELDTEVHVVILTGAGRGFCTGGDLSEFNSFHEKGDAMALAGYGWTSLPTYLQIGSGTKPVISMVNGVAYAGGFVLAMESDIVVAARSARFKLPEALLGMSDVYAAAHLPITIGLARAKFMLLTCCEITADEAHAWGLVARVVDDDQLEAETMRVAEAIKLTQPLARSWNKAILNRWLPPFDSRALRETATAPESGAGTQRFAR